MPRPAIPRVKVCGVTSPEEAVLAARAGADFVGLNFHPPSPRYVTPERAREIAGAVRGSRAGGAQAEQPCAGGAPAKKVELVGVFVNRPRAEVEAIDAAVGLDLLQFHGDETPADVAPFASRALKAFRVREAVDDALLAGFEGVWGILIDASHPELYGGTGRSWQFASLRGLSGVVARRAFIAGGLSPDNVRAAIDAARPWGVDLCSGLESRPGKKDPELLERLFLEIRHGAQ